jgi:hypothetical protein
MKPSTHVGALSALTLMLAACDDAGEGTIRVNLKAEETITEGLSTGAEEENTKDYDVSYSKFIVTIGRVELGQASSGRQRKDETLYVVDLTQIGEEGVEIARFENVPPGQWDEFGFETAAATPGTKAIEVSSADAQEMVEHGWTYWIEGTVARPLAQGGPVDFVIQTDVPTSFYNCRHDGEPGLSAVENRTTSGDVTIHGDHLWFNSFPTGSEGSVERRAAWIVQADTDGDGKVSTEDLAALDATEVFTTQLGYSLDGPDEIVIDNALDFVRAQLATQGHFMGEGECIWRFEGATGD